MWRSRWDSLPVRDAWPRCAAHCERIWQHRPYATGLRSPARLRPPFAKCGTDGVKPKECLRDDPRQSGSASLSPAVEQTQREYRPIEGLIASFLGDGIVFVTGTGALAAAYALSHDLPGVAHG